MSLENTGCVGFLLLLLWLLHLGAIWGDRNDGGGNVETFEFTLNSTSITQFAYGIAANVAAVLLYGSNFVPVKRIETGDGKHLRFLKKKYLHD